MRVDGSEKTLIAGVSTRDDKLHNGTFAKQVDNFKCDGEKGLVRRPRTQYDKTASQDGVSPGNESVFPVVLENIDYWVVVQNDPSAENTVVTLYRADEDITDPEDMVYLSGLKYLKGISSVDDLAWTVVNDILYIANKLRTVEMFPEVGVPIQRSFLVIKVAPQPYSTIEITWTGSDDARQSIQYDTPSDATADTGTNTVATAIAGLITAELAAGDAVFVKGSTVSIFRADDLWSDITVSDGAGNTVADSVNRETNNIANLPKFAPKDITVMIRPNKENDKGIFYMRSELYIGTDIDAEEPDPPYFTEFRGIKYFWHDSNTFGYSIWNLETGTLVPNTVPGGGPIIEIFELRNWWADNMVTMSIHCPFQTVDHSQITQITIVDTTTGYSVFDEPMRYFDEGSWRSPRVQPFTMHDDRLYQAYVNLPPGVFGALPEVAWKETSNPTQPVDLNADTLPIIIGRIDDDRWGMGVQGQDQIINTHAVRRREAGDNDSNPIPGFVGQTINALGRFQDRLVVLAGEDVDMSVTKHPHAWWRETVTQQLANDPINMKSSSPDAGTLNSLVHHNNDLLLFSERVQFKIVGGVAMTAGTASLAQTSNYVNTNVTYPVSDGTNVFFPTQRSKEYAGLSIFQTDPNADVQDRALSLTEEVHEYLPGTMKFIAASSVNNLIACVTDAAPNHIYIYEYSQDRDNQQQAWCRWILDPEIEILGIHFAKYILYVVVLDKDYEIVFLTMHLNEHRRDGEERYLRLDYLYTKLQNGIAITLPDGYPETDAIQIYQGSDGETPGQLIPYTRNGKDIILTGVLLEDQLLHMGIPYTSIYVPCRKWVRDDDGRVQTDSHLRITDYKVWMRGDSLTASLVPATGTTEIWPDQILIGNTGDLNTHEPDEDTLHRIAFKQRPKDVVLTYSTTGAYNLVIRQIEWRGTYFKVGRRF